MAAASLRWTAVAAAVVGDHVAAAIGEKTTFARPNRPPKAANHG
jgi:hypothetical protein